MKYILKGDKVYCPRGGLHPLFGRYPLVVDPRIKPSKIISLSVIFGD